MADREGELLAIIHIAVADFVRLIDLDQEGTLAQLRDHRRELIEPRVAELNGRIVQSTGDSLLLEFHSLVDAANCAVRIQAGMAARNAGLGEDRRVDFRIGLASGSAVDIVAQLAGLAEPGCICLSHATREQIGDRIKVRFEASGELEIDGEAEPIQVYKIDLGSKRTPRGLARLSRAHRYGIAAIVAGVVIFYSYEIWFGNFMP
ncbi:MAG: adenylate/guanylate cyclase domain-containing protein [Rhodospirillaceae bacterium]|jgi:adenylate cyclase|nr:adenylate/guanylate cyclase domain-containing protein [Rhodospirillaceae bacterium]MBT4486976.1 adenylate/guanylate cyclase domain-containing protein [Rhodospirillaceae bacterium]MBT5191788.1 adenylate/guanylate cyclase domain-containing protein [Rhodospirillaceae bacterium]MBT5894481.1 adenylate/guanylate cyclase domain-containing protein [Rhodospirillaceae bacterium]MBT6431191.1 adenylate/guanylate cyclase domain-containing protein [Rhodospirillaceae bacterium]